MGDNNQDIINGNENDVESIKEQLNEIVGEEIGSVSAIDNDGEEILNENIVKDIHSILMENILVGGIYRNVEVRITGAKHKPPVPSEMYHQIKDFFSNLNFKSDLNPIELASWTHAEFVKIHPFVDGNGRTSRLIMNYQLMKNGFLPISVNKEDKLDYFNFLEEYAVNGNLEPFADFLAVLEEKQLDEYLSIIK